MNNVSIKFDLSLLEEAQKHYTDIEWNSSYDFKHKFISLKKFKTIMEKIYGKIDWKKCYYLNVSNNKFYLYEDPCMMK